jgi:hypothetical protein
MAKQVSTHRASIEDVVAGALRSWWFLGLLSVGLFGLLALSWPSWFNRFAITTTTRYIEISASLPKVQEIGVKLPGYKEIQILGARPEDLPPELVGLATPAVSVRMFVSSAVLQGISLPSGAGLAVLSTADGGSDIGVLNGGSISLALSGKVERIDESGMRTTIASIARSTVWEIRPAERSKPARLVLASGAGPIAFYNMPIDDFWFRPPPPADDDPRTYESEILKGELQLLDIGAKVELRPRELLLLEGGRRFLSRLNVADGAIAVDIIGEANRISIGPPRLDAPLHLDRDLTPSVLSYLVGQHELKLLWGAAVTVLGSLWTARQWALRWSK